MSQISFTDSLKNQETEEYRLALDRNAGWKETRSEFVSHLGDLVGTDSPFVLTLNYLQHTSYINDLLDNVGVRKAFNEVKDDDYGAVFSLLLVHADLKDIGTHDWKAIVQFVKKKGRSLTEKVVEEMTRKIRKLLLNCPSQAFKKNLNQCYMLRVEVNKNFIAAVSLLHISSTDQP